MRLDVADPRAERPADPGQGADLVDARRRSARPRRRRRSAGRSRPGRGRTRERRSRRRAPGRSARCGPWWTGRRRGSRRPRWRWSPWRSRRRRRRAPSGRSPRRRRRSGPRAVGSSVGMLLVTSSSRCCPIVVERSHTVRRSALRAGSVRGRVTDAGRSLGRGSPRDRSRRDAGRRRAGRRPRAPGHPRRHATAWARGCPNRRSAATCDVSRNTLREAFRAAGRGAAGRARAQPRASSSACRPRRTSPSCTTSADSWSAPPSRPTRAAPPGSSDVVETLERADATRGAQDWVGVGTADIDFHRELTALASTRVVALMQSVWNEMRLAFHVVGPPGRVPRVLPARATTRSSTRCVERGGAGRGADAARLPRRGRERRCCRPTAAAASTERCRCTATAVSRGRRRHGGRRSRDQRDRLVDHGPPVRLEARRR